jgi:ubiquinol-cytochrome c reductase iron-sulfur subunit
MLRHLAALDAELVDPQSTAPQQPGYATNPQRAVRPEYLVVVGICTHLGCSPSAKLAAGGGDGMEAAWPGGFFCP